MLDPQILGVDPSRPLDAVFVNSPLKDYDTAPRHNDFTLRCSGSALSQRPPARRASTWVSSTLSRLASASRRPLR